MGNLYRVVPVNKKSVRLCVKATRDDSWFTVEELHRDGQGFSPEEDGLPAETDEIRTDLGCGCGLDSSEGLGNSFEFSEDITESEKERIQEGYNEGDEDGAVGMGWVGSPSSNGWWVDEAEVVITGPFEIQLVDGDSYDVLKENIKLKKRKV